jgi:hypothetical protein
MTEHQVRCSKGARPVHPHADVKAGGERGGDRNGDIQTNDAVDTNAFRLVHTDAVEQSLYGRLRNLAPNPLGRIGVPGEDGAAPIEQRERGAAGQFGGCRDAVQLIEADERNDDAFQVA